MLLKSRIYTIAAGTILIASSFTLPASAQLPTSTESELTTGSKPSDICHLPTYGGNYYCGYGYQSNRFPDGTVQVYVIGTDFSVWTRWTKNGRLSNWVSLGGKIRHTYKSSDFFVGLCGNQPFVRIYGLDNQLWSNIRHEDGTWSGWGPYHGYACPG